MLKSFFLGVCCRWLVCEGSCAAGALAIAAKGTRLPWEWACRKAVGRSRGMQRRGVFLGTGEVAV